MQVPNARTDEERVGGRYELIEPVGEGNFAVAYRAMDVVLERPVAVKMLRQQYASNPTFVARFEREARVAASVSHPNVVDVYDFGPFRNTYFIAMQFVPGPTLKAALAERGRFAPDAAVRTAVQILEGLSAIHAAGIVHRDIKPQNVLLGRDEVARVTDFGVAHYPIQGGLTTHGTTVGTASYMAPEQARGGALSEATDLYAVGVVLFELLTGRLPFEAENPMAVMLAHIQQPVPSMQALAPDAGIPSALDAEVRRAMAKAPADRPASANAMAAALRSSLDGPSESRTATMATVVPIGARGREERTSGGAVGRPVAGGSASRPPGPIGPAPALPKISPRRRAASWLAPLLLFAVAVAAAGGFIASGGGLPGIGDGNGGREPGSDPPVIAVVDGTATGTSDKIPTAIPATTTPRPPPRLLEVPAPATDEGSGGPGSTAAPAATEAAIPEPTATARAVSVPTATTQPRPTERPTAPPAPTATAIPVPTETPTPTPKPTEPPEPTPTSEPTAEIVVVDPVGGILGGADAGEPGGEEVIPDPPAAESPPIDAGEPPTPRTGGTGRGASRSFSAADWSGGAVTRPNWYGQPAVAIYGAEGSLASARLAFDLGTVPTTDYVLTLTGLGDESGVPFAFEVGVNGSSATGQITGFPNWDPAVHGERGQNAPWSEIRIPIAAGLLRQGTNDITVFSRQPGAHGSGTPHLLLSAARLQPDRRAAAGEPAAVELSTAGGAAEARAKKDDRSESGNSGRSADRARTKKQESGSSGRSGRDEDDDEEGDD